MPDSLEVPVLGTEGANDGPTLMEVDSVGSRTSNNHGSQSNKELIVLSLAVILSLTRQAPWDELGVATHNSNLALKTTTEIPDFKNGVTPPFYEMGTEQKSECSSDLFKPLFELGKCTRITDWLEQNKVGHSMTKAYPTILPESSGQTPFWNNDDNVALAFYQESSKDLLSVLPKPASLSSGSESPTAISDWLFDESEPWQLLDPGFLGFLTQEDDSSMAMSNGMSAASDSDRARQVEHNHTYASAADGPLPGVLKPDMRSSKNRNRDPRRLLEAGVDLSYDDLIECDSNKFAKLLSRYSTQQQSVLIAMRKRGKNRLAAANCRAKKEQLCSRMRYDVESVADQLRSARRQLKAANKHEAQLREKYNELYLGLMNRVHGPNDEPVNLNQIQVRHGSDAVGVRVMSANQHM